MNTVCQKEEAMSQKENNYRHLHEANNFKLS
jgi:hypothetical protein